MDLNFQAQEKSFAHTAQVLRTMEAVAVAVSQKESTLLVGETGTGKSTLVQHLADQVGQTLRFCQLLHIQERNSEEEMPLSVGD